MSITLLMVGEAIEPITGKHDMVFVNYGDGGEMTVHQTLKGDVRDINDPQHREEFSGQEVSVSEVGMQQLQQIGVEQRQEAEEKEMIVAQMVRYRFPNKNGDFNGEKFLVNISIWGRDCDNAEATSLEQIPATLEAYVKRYERLEYEAEGPISLTIVSPEEAQQFHATFRDRNLEASENGHPHIIY